MKKLITATCMLLLAAAMVGTTTFAWFSMNRTVSTTGMKVTAKVDASLVITSGAIPSSTTSAFKVEFNDAKATELLASTHDSNYTNYASGLKYVTNKDKVDPASGIAKTGETLTYANATTDYYKDYVVYIAAAGVALSAQDIAVTLDSTTSYTDIDGAVSVDFYGVLTKATIGASSVASTFVKTANFLGTLNLAGKQNGESSPTTYTTFNISNVSIPLPDGVSTNNQAYAVLMRVYVDGALYSSGTSKAYVNNSDAKDISGVEFGVKFVASDRS